MIEQILNEYDKVIDLCDLLVKIANRSKSEFTDDQIDSQSEDRKIRFRSMVLQLVLSNKELTK